MLDKTQLSKIIEIIKQVASKEPPGNKVKAMVASGELQEENAYYVVCIAVTGNQEVAELIHDLMETVFQELSEKLSREDESNLYTM